MKILYSNKEYVDFAAPIFSNEQQRTKIVDFFKKNFPNIEVIEDVKEKDKVMNIKPRAIKHWTAEELYLLILPLSSEEICDKTGRNIMSVNMKRSSFEPEFRAWLRQRGYQFPGTQDNLNEFFKDQGDKP